jgi:hypothetical protein
MRISRGGSSSRAVGRLVCASRARLCSRLVRAGTNRHHRRRSARGAGVAFKTRIRNGITGSFRILPSGDPSVGPITVSVAKRSFVPIGELHPGQRLVSAARHG